MVCIYCGHDTKVTNSRPNKRLPAVWRRRECSLCVAQFTTHETADYAASVVVVSHGKLYPFSRDRLYLSLHQALAHRTDAIDCSTELTNTVMGRLSGKKYIADGAISVHLLAKTAHEVLKRFDSLAANTYKAYHMAALKKPHI